MKIRALLLLCFSIVFLTCKEEKKPVPPAPETPLVILISVSPTSFDPQIPFDDSDYVLANVYDPLVKFDASFQLTQGLAQRWTNPDDKTWRFYLKPDAKFSDGSPLLASDVKFSIERMQQLSGSDRQGFTEHIVAVEIIDPHTVDIKTNSPVIILNNLVYIPILSEKDVLAKKTPPFLGTGPYKFKSIEKDKKVVLDRNPHRHPVPAVAEVQYQIIESPDQIFEDIARHNPDLILTLPFRKIEEFRKLKKEGKIKNLDIRSAKGISVYYVVFNLNVHNPDFPGKNPLTDLRLRKAIAMATDKNELVQVVLKGLGRPATQLIAPEVFGFDPATGTPAYDVAAATKLVQESGYSGIQIPVYGSDSGTNIMEKTLIEQWKKAGINGELRRINDETYARRLAEGQLTLGYSGYSCGSGDASELLTFSLHSRGTEEKFGKGNFAFYRNEEVDRISHENLRIFDPKERLNLLKQSMRIVSEELPYLPLVVFNDVYIVSSRLQWQPVISGEIIVADMSFR